MKLKIAALAIVIALAIGLSAQPASAHADLISTEPTSGQVLESAPGALTFKFTEAVTLTKDTIRLYNSNGEEQKLPNATHLNGDSAAITVPIDGLDEGAYVAMYRVVSADSHPIHGAITFQVGNVSGDTSAITSKLLAGESADASVRVVQAALRGLMLGSTIIGLGALILSVVFRSNETLFDLAYRTTGYSFLTLGISTVFGLFSQAVYVNVAPLSDFFNPDLARSTLYTRYGYGCLLRFAAVASLALVLPEVRERTIWRFAALAAGVSVIMSFAVSGHAGTGRWPWAGITLDVIHMMAGSVWFGGLFLFIVAMFMTSVDAAAVRSGLARFSKIALICAIAIAASGVFQAVRQIQSTDVLFDTAYGRLIIAKTGLYALIVAAAWFSRKATNKWTLASDQDTDTVQRKALRIGIGIEVVIATAIVTVTTILMTTSPIGTVAAAGSAPIVNAGGPFSQAATSDNINVSLQLPQTRSGPNNLEVKITDLNGQPLDVPEVNIRLTLPSAGLGPLPVELTKVSPGNFTATNTVVPISGEWAVSVTVRTTEIDQTAITFNVPFA